MQTILGSTGQIAIELDRNLHHFHTSDLRLVSRNPRRVNATDTLMPADLLDVEQTHAAVAGSDIVYFTAGLPADTELWEAQFPTMLKTPWTQLRPRVRNLFISTTLTCIRRMMNRKTKTLRSRQWDARARSAPR